MKKDNAGSYGSSDPVANEVMLSNILDDLDF
jgi:hypothetical protein